MAAEHSGGGIVADVPRTVHDCPDHEDNLILDLAAEVGALLVVSNDTDLLSMSPWRGTPIIEPTAFAAKVDAMRRHARRRPIDRDLLSWPYPSPTGTSPTRSCHSFQTSDSNSSGQRRVSAIGGGAEHSENLSQLGICPAISGRSFDGAARREPGLRTSGACPR